MSFENLQKKWENQFSGSTGALDSKAEIELLEKIRRGRRSFRLAVILIAVRDVIFFSVLIWVVKITASGGLGHLSPEIIRRDRDIRLAGLGLVIALSIVAMKIRPTLAQITPSADEGRDALPGRVRGDRRRFDAMILWRDLREIGACVFLVAITVVQAWHAKHNPALLWIAAGLFAIPGIALLTYRLRTRRRRTPVDDTLIGALTYSIYRTRRQVQLLDNVWWYIAPIMLGAGLIQESLSNGRVHRSASIAFTVFIAVGWAVWRLNRWFARSRLRPRLEQLEKLKAELSTDVSSNQP